MRGWSARPACRRDRFFRNDLRDVFAPRVAFDSWQPKIFDATPSREGGRLLDDLGAFHHLESMCTGLAPSAFINRSSVHVSPSFEAPFLKKRSELLRSRRGRAFFYLTLLPGFDCSKQCPLLEGLLSEHRFDGSSWISSRESQRVREARSSRTVERT